MRIRHLTALCKTKNCEMSLNPKLFECCCFKPFTRLFFLCQNNHTRFQSSERTIWGESSRRANFVKFKRGGIFLIGEILAVPALSCHSWWESPPRHHRDGFKPSYCFQWEEGRSLGDRPLVSLLNSFCYKVSSQWVAIPPACVRLLRVTLSRTEPNTINALCPRQDTFRHYFHELDSLSS